MLKIILKVGVCFVLLISVSSFKTHGSNETLAYYYYQNEKLYLNPDNSGIFFLLRNPMTEDDFQNLIGENKSRFNTGEYDSKETMQIVKLSSPETIESINSLVSTLKSKPGFEYVSPVFRMPADKGNSKVQLGYLNEIIVQFKADMNYNAAAEFLSKNNLQIINKLDLSGGEAFHLKISSGDDAMKVANEIFESGMTNYSEPNFFQTNLLAYAPNDSLYQYQWPIRNTGHNLVSGWTSTPDCDMDVDSVWDVSTGMSSVTVSIVDTGIDTLHPDLQSKILHGKGYNFYSNNTNSMDDHKHGTCCAGIIGAEANNTIGISGIAPNAKIFGIKVFNSSLSATSTSILNGLIYVKTSGSWVSNNSWLGGSPSSAGNNAILDGVTNGRGGKGIVYCFASGNFDSSYLYWPANNPNVIAVGGMSFCNQRKSLTSCDLEPWGASYGPGLTIVAPCSSIYTTDRRGTAGYSTTDYERYFSGTSSAAPNATGACALILGLDTNMRWDTLRARIARLADKVGSYNYNQPGYLGIGGWNNEMGYGKINAYNVLKYTADHMSPVQGSVTLAEEGFFNRNTSMLNIRDTVKIYLRNSSPPYALADSVKTVIDSANLSGSLFFSNALTGTYYIVVRHRNSLETWSKTSGQGYAKGFILNYNFTSSASQAYGNNMLLIGNKYCLYSGDITQDGVIDGSDLGIIDYDAYNFSTGYIQSDVTGNFITDAGDLIIADNNAFDLITKKRP